MDLLAFLAKKPISLKSCPDSLSHSNVWMAPDSMASGSMSGGRSFWCSFASACARSCLMSCSA